MTKTDVKKLHADLKSLQEERNRLFSIVEPINKALVDNYESIALIRRKLDDEANKTGSISLEELFNPDNCDLYYRTRSKVLEDMELMGSGYWPDTGQPAVRIALKKGDSNKTETVCKSIQTLLPFIIPQEGFALFSVFEHTLSETYSYYIQVSPSEDFAKLVRNRFSRRETVLEGTLKEVLNYIEKHHYYE